MSFMSIEVTIFVSSALDLAQAMNAESMKKASDPTQYEQTNSDPDMRSEYDFQGGVRGKYAHRFARGIQRDMVPEHARKEWDAEVAANGELISRAPIQIKTEED